MSASVKIMLSYDYCHFEVCKSTDEELTNKQVNELRKDVQRLADEAVRQFKMAKNLSEENIEYDRQKFLKDIERIKAKPASELTPQETGRLKAYQDDNWQSQFTNYD